MEQHHTSKRFRTLLLAFARATVPGRKQKLFPCPTSVLFIGCTVSNNTFQPILRGTPFPRLFPSLRQERSQNAGYRGQTPGISTIHSSYSNSSIWDTMGGSHSHCTESSQQRSKGKRREDSQLEMKMYWMKQPKQYQYKVHKLSLVNAQWSQ